MRIYTGLLTGSPSPYVLIFRINRIYQEKTAKQEA
jgi:hypothetical protein